MRELVCIRSQTGFEPVAQGLKRKLGENRQYTAAFQLINDSLMASTILREIYKLKEVRPKILIFLWDGVDRGSRLKRIREAVAALGQDKLVILVEISSEVREASDKFRNIFTESAENVQYMRVDPKDTTVSQTLYDRAVEFLSRRAIL